MTSIQPLDINKISFLSNACLLGIVVDFVSWCCNSFSLLHVCLKMKKYGQIRSNHFISHIM